MARHGASGWSEASLGVDLGGTKIALGVVDPTGRLLDQVRLPTQASRPASAVIADVVATIRSRWSDAVPADRPLGIGVAGQIAPEGTVLFGPNLNWHQVPLRAELERSLGRPVAVLNDVRAATYGEWKHGAGQRSEDLVCLFVGTGVGGGIVADGRLRHGATGTAGELGHLSVARDGRPCRCPNRGCLEAYAGGWAIADRAREAVSADPARGRRLTELAGSLEAITSETVEAAFRTGDPLARDLVHETTAYLADGLVSIANALNPSTIVLGGGVVAGYPSLIGTLQAEVRRRALPAAVEGLRVVPAALGGESGLIGAASFARAAQGS